MFLKMGIPSFFAHLVRNHSQCIRPIDHAFAPGYLFLDANSIIYDCVYKLCRSIGSADHTPSEEEFVSLILRETLVTIELYSTDIGPSELLFVAFDGNPPAAKLYQQRARRHKSQLTNAVLSRTAEEVPYRWDTTQITPGTRFMNTLMSFLSEELPKMSTKARVVLSGSNVPGEGEHKIFSHLRDNADTIGRDADVVIYGLDADLIMLSLNHLSLFPRILLYRETPAFIAQIDRDLDPDTLYTIDLAELGRATAMQLAGAGSRRGEDLVQDYILMCFLLGNDFIPHTPSVCIRSNGIEVLLSAYRTCSKRNEKFALTEGGRIQWRHLREFFNELKRDEHVRIKEEAKSRNAAERRHTAALRGYEMERRFELIPSFRRAQEKYVNPFANGWRKRYYDELNGALEETDIRKMCVNFFQALEWTYHYYSQGCKDWRWSYNYPYAPLFEDLARNASYFNIEYLPFSTVPPVSTACQLCVVMPPSSRHVLPTDLAELMDRNYSHMEKFPRMTWAFCRYLWEAHVHFDRFDLTKLEEQIAAQHVQ